MSERATMSWSGWGDPTQATELPAAIGELLRSGLGVTRATPAPAQIDDLALEPVRLDPEVAARLTGLVGLDHASADHAARVRHALGRSTLDLLALRRGARLPAPDLVLAPASPDEVMAVLGVCSAEHVAVVPFGGGTSVVGGVTPDAESFAGWVALDLRRLDALTELDEVSRLATLGPGLRGPDAEALLAARGYTIGHFPQSFEYATLGGFAAARSSGQASAGYGRFDELVSGMRVAAPAGELHLGRAPKSAAGPDLRQLVLGSEGAFGVITELTVRVRPAPAERIYDGWRFDDFASGCAALRRLIQDGPVPTVLRLSDEAETAMGLARPDAIGSGEASGCLAIAGYEGERDDVAARRRAATAVFTAAGATEVPEAGAGWEHGRYRGPYLRDALLDAGALVETLETVTFWAGVPALYAAVTAALRETLTALGTPPVVLCHVSHVYPAGASLYFTVACAQTEDPIAQWRAAKRATGAAILDHGGSISHHQGSVATTAPSSNRSWEASPWPHCGRSKRPLTPPGSSIPEYSLLHKVPQTYLGVTEHVTMPASVHHEQIAALADLVVAFGANLQPGQILAIASEPGKEPLTRAVAEAAYRRGAKFVDLSVFDVHLKRARALYADPDTLGFVPPWLGERALSLGEHRCARVALTGPSYPHALDGVDPALLGRDRLPSLKESMQVLDAGTTNWTAIPCPTPDWATLVYPDAGPDEALDRLWSAVNHMCRLDEADPIATWNTRLDELEAKTEALDALALDALHFVGPGTDLTVGLLPSSHWCAARFTTVDGIVHAPNIPTEEVFTTPDAARVDGHVTSTKPLFTSGTTITGLKVRFEAGRAVSIEADQGAEVMRSLIAHDDGAARLGEVALVDRTGRIGPLDTVFYDTLIDENAASHIALGQSYRLGVRDQTEFTERANHSEIHVDFMIGSDAVAVTGVRRDGSEIPLLRDGDWQI